MQSTKTTQGSSIDGNSTLTWQYATSVGENLPKSLVLFFTIFFFIENDNWSSPKRGHLSRTSGLPGGEMSGKDRKQTPFVSFNESVLGRGEGGLKIPIFAGRSSLLNVHTIQRKCAHYLRSPLIQT